jgi:hypothetical protein
VTHVLFGTIRLLQNKVIRCAMTWFSRFEGRRTFNFTHRQLAYESATTGCCHAKEGMMMNFILINSLKNKSIHEYIYNMQYTTLLMQTQSSIYNFPIYPIHFIVFTLLRIYHKLSSDSINY